MGQEVSRWVMVPKDRKKQRLVDIFRVNHVYILIYIYIYIHICSHPSTKKIKIYLLNISFLSDVFSIKLLYTWAVNVLYFGVKEPSKRRPKLHSKQGSFGTQIQVGGVGSQFHIFSSAWRIIPPLGYVVRMGPPCKSHEKAIGMGVPQPYLGDLRKAMLINHVSKSWDDPPGCSFFIGEHFTVANHQSLPRRCEVLMYLGLALS